MDLGDRRQTTRQGEEDGNEKSRVVLSEYADVEREVVDGRRQFREDRSTAAIREEMSLHYKKMAELYRQLYGQDCPMAAFMEDSASRIRSPGQN